MLVTIIYAYLLKTIFFLNAEIFQQNIGDKMTIGLTDKGYKTVELRCGPESMVVDLETEDEFQGIIYTRGSFYSKETPCFQDIDDERAQKLFKIEIPFDKCDTIKKGNIYSNVLVLQHDKELIMPGDAAFSLECDFSEPRDVTLTADMQSVYAVASRITLIDADPAKPIRKINKVATFESYTNSVVITSDSLRRRREEL
ncbi:hypothetical protein NQ315_005466 [Exocentrus adspersus]|uniref:ZP domain-containing protein n=1 Tax=Exocentrus adspersus TaxID=1586481 RepID=A0AAV8VU44_9CUCU|nr:hypothetical protein NQ315_005466 [Exocentrus adspersus]